VVFVTTCRRASGSLATLPSRTILPASSTMQTLVSLTDSSSKNRMRTSFHHQPEARHPNFQLATSWHADYPIFGVKSDMSARGCLVRVAVLIPRNFSGAILTFRQGLL